MIPASVPPSCARFAATESDLPDSIARAVDPDSIKWLYTKITDGREVMKNTSCSIAVVAGLACLAAVTSAGSAEPAAPGGGEHWSAVRIFDPFRNESRCVAESARQVINDGHQDTTIFLRVDQSSLLVLTESNVDLSRPNVGVRIDDGELIKPDKMYLDQNVLFESTASRIIAQFKPGLMVQVSLHFWPTWPSKGLKTATFSLVGFTRAFAQLPGC
jgi:hypothetical protein